MSNNLTCETIDIPGALLVTSRRFDDDRGTLWEAMTQQTLAEATGTGMPVAQVNAIQSQQGAIRGLHAYRVPPGQAKYVVCLSGELQAVAADLRQSSTTFGKAESVLLSDHGPQALYVPPGVASGFLTLSAKSVVVYLSSQPFNPDFEYGVNPLDETFGISWKTDKPILSPRDAGAPSLKTLHAAGDLPA